ncbi:MafI family immunity protein [Desertifilum sp. FACHB-1129]|uniref:MafI family immunity protein n=1 Tax=unclassified Desertifilum TaxID=2621682 RepID=UPI0016834C31|nr:MULTISPECIES: MafI family immunity protein [unclassified Desertifilum]MBD2311134.1 MafI family immunity protein [Desertifilum sp. FACHB-1129]MBD2324001.1 MafI family immunity protein [Desertifilum sp. FACHB-866]MBD2333936.1 MafI family immunity protein [Desertifilum sp. FACHB-868]MDA0211247.1 MafI family immunity protein [Cyanobacteria bacterium FC1]
MIDSKSVVDALNSALLSVCESLTESQIATIKEYIYVGEWGLALETLCSFLYEEDVNISHKSYKLIEQAGERLTIDNNTWKILESQIKV